MIAPQPKPEPIKRAKARRLRAETKIRQQIRAACVARDGDCRLRGKYGFICGGASEWAHLGEQRRAKTRGMPPALRHTTAGSLMLCTKHHRAYDACQLQIYHGADGADGPLTFIGAAYPPGKRSLG
jgi:hypothetical protein